MIVRIEHEESAGLAREKQAHGKAFDPAEFDETFDTVEDFCRSFSDSVRNLELTERLGERGQSWKILDIGVGAGESSIYLSSLNHEVVCIEPTPVLCERIEHASQRFGYPMTIYECPAEVADAIPDEDFDVCIFNSSLHHCDDPDRALRNCHHLLRPGGRILAINEPVLRFYRSHEWFERRLANHPVEMGHYGGNEYSYHYSEYIDMLQGAGFSEVEGLLAVRYERPSRALEDIMWRRVDGERVYSDEALLRRLALFVVLKHTIRSRPMGSLLTAALKRLSLLQSSFVGVKR